MAKDNKIDEKGLKSFINQLKYEGVDTKLFPDFDTKKLHSLGSRLDDMWNVSPVPVEPGHVPRKKASIHEVINTISSEMPELIPFFEKAAGYTLPKNRSSIKRNQGWRNYSPSVFGD